MKKAPVPPPRPNQMLVGGLWLVAALPLAFDDSLIASATLPKLALLAAAVLACSIGGLLSARGGFRPAATPLDGAFLFAAAALSASAFLSRDRILSVVGAYNYYVLGVWPLALLAAIFYFSAWSLRDAGRRRWTLKIVLGAGAGVALYACLQWLGLDPFPVYGQASRLVGGRAVGTMGSPVSLGAYLALIFPLALHWLLDQKKERVFAWFCLAAVGGGLLGSIARGAWLSAAVGGVSYLALAGRLRIPRWSSGRWAASACAMGLLAITLAALASRRHSTRINELARFELWAMAWRAFLDHPALGMGPDTFELAFRRYRPLSYILSIRTFEHQVHAHNDFVQALATTGLCGAAAYLFWLWSLLTAAGKAWSDQSRRLEAAALVSALLSLFVGMKFNPVSLDSLGVAVVLCGLLCAAVPERNSAAPAASSWPARAGLWAMLAASAYSAYWSQRLWRADHAMKHAMNESRAELALRGYQEALTLNPCEMSYRIQFLSFLNEKGSAAQAAGRDTFFALAADSGRRAVACHPGLSNAHYALAVADFLQVQAGHADLLARVETSLDAAIELDPLFKPLLELRQRAALLRQDIPRIAALQQQIDKLKFQSN